MTLENTDKALASLIDATHKLSTQLSPDVFDAASQVAMLGFQGNLLSAWIWTIASGIVALIALGLLIMACAKNWDEAAGATAMMAFFVSVIVFCWNISTLWNPLINAAAHDGKIALAIKVIVSLQ